MQHRDGSSKGGPRTEAGKRRASRNSLKEGLYSKELVINQADTAEFDALKAALKEHLKSSNVLEEIAFERIVSCAWRLKLAIRMEMRRLSGYFEDEAQQEQAAKEERNSPIPVDLYFLTRAAAKAAARTLTELRADIDRLVPLDEEKWKERLTNLFGAVFAESIFTWKPKNPMVTVVAESMVTHAERFKVPLPPALTEGGQPRPLEADDSSRQEMLIKLVEMELAHVDILQRVFSGLGSGAGYQNEQMDFGNRYYTSAARELERAVNWFYELKYKR